MVFRDPYMLDFLGLKDTYSEKNLEASILRELESFHNGSHLQRVCIRVRDPAAISYCIRPQGPMCAKISIAGCGLGVKSTTWRDLGANLPGWFT